jgi:hypothetical protein
MAALASRLGSTLPFGKVNVVKGFIQRSVMGMKRIVSLKFT